MTPWITGGKQWKEEGGSGDNGLRAEVALIAKKELREDKHTREQCLQQFKEWIKKNEDLSNCFTDDKFLLRFLRTKKFSVPMAEQMLLKYLNLRKNYKHMTFDLDFQLKKMMELINTGYMFVSPIRDQHGRRVIISIANRFDPHRFNCDDMARIHTISYETLLEDEENQVLGFTHFGDIQGFSASHVTLWSPTEFATVVKWGEQSFPARHKEVHIINLPTAFRYVYEFARGRLSQKMKERIKIHPSLESLHRKLDPRVLPKEYGGVVPMSEMIEQWKGELASRRDRLLSLDTMNLLSDRGIIRRRNKTADETGIGSLPGSFRKLELD